MWFLTIFTYAAILIQVIFATIAIAAGLYYVAELVEEYNSYTKKCINYANAVVSILFACLWLFESFPASMVACGLLAQTAHYVIVRSFPYVSFSSPAFLSAIALLLVNHYLAFQYFAAHYYAFSEVIAYFTLCLWLVPFSLFVSLSANDSVLPTTAEKLDSDIVSNYFSKNRKYGLLSFFNYAKESILPERNKKGF